MGDIKKAVELAVAIANDPKHGYDQQHRNGPDYDCSSLIATVLHEAGFNISPDSWTGNLAPQLRAEGFKLCTAPWKAGDIHLNITHHVCMSVDTDNIVEASLNEKGDITGGQTGDQTGNEISVKPYYNYRYGWSYHLRAPQKFNVYPLTLMQVAVSVMLGTYGNEPDRSIKLREDGYDPDCIQQIINIVYKIRNQYYD